MTAKRKLAGAFLTQPNWKDINWPAHEAVVKQLQVRIAKAVKINRWGKVKSLQHLLINSYSAKVLSVRKVTQNKGKNTPGVDGVILKTLRQKAALIPLLKRRDYQPKPLRRIYIRKKNGKLRPLSIPTILDRCMQQLYYLSLSPISETTADGNSYGFRPERRCADAIEDIFMILGRKYSACWILEGDIKGCFDHISHQWLMENICMDKIVLKKWLKAGYIETKKLFPTHEGTPQGGIISPCLSNFVLDGVNKMLNKNFGVNRPGIHFVRYADDFIITARTEETLAEAKMLMIGFLKERGLELSLEKTKTTHIDEGFDFLGQNVRKYPAGKNRKKLLIKPSKDNVKSFLKKIRQTIRKSGTWTQTMLINTLNPMIRGWVNFHRSVVSKDTFNKIDREIWLTLWKWAKRRHSKKSSGWVIKKYFIKKGLRKYCFSGKQKLDNGTVSERNLIIACATPIIRHTKIRSKANIFDPECEEYFERRKSAMMTNSKTGTAKIYALLKRQSNICTYCGKYMNIKYPWVIHRITSRLKGGGDNISNLRIMHDICHKNGFQSRFVYKAAGHKLK